MAVMEEPELSVILDLGSGISKAGFAGSETPTFVFPSVVSKRDNLVGEDVLKVSEEISFEHPISRGMLTNVDDMDTLVQHAFDNIEVDPSDHIVLVSEPALPSTLMREKLAKSIFETFGCEALYPFNQSSAALFSAGRTTGVVVNCGAGTTTALPIASGYCSHHALYSRDYGGIDVIQRFCQNRNGSIFFWESLLHKVGYVSLQQQNTNIEPEEITLPDGQQVTLDSERYDCLEEFISGSKGLSEAVCEAIATSEEDYGTRQTFFENILLHGGVSKAKNFHERFLIDIKQFSPDEFEPKIVEFGIQQQALHDPSYSTWNGGSIMALLSSTQEKLIHRDQYDEEGLRAINRLSLFE